MCRCGKNYAILETNQSLSCAGPPLGLKVSVLNRLCNYLSTTYEVTVKLN